MLETKDVSGPRGVSEVLAILLKQAARTRLIVVSDFNRRIVQRGSTPRRLRAALQSTLGPNLSIATAGLGFQGRRTIDHIALSGDLAAETLSVIGNVHRTAIYRTILALSPTFPLGTVTDGLTRVRNKTRLDGMA